MKPFEITIKLVKTPRAKSPRILCICYTWYTRPEVSNIFYSRAIRKIKSTQWSKLYKHIKKIKLTNTFEKN